jgi:hypothetical protein
VTKIKSFVLALSFVAVTAFVFADINLGSSFRWGIPAGAVSFKLRVLDSVNAPVAIADPATHDPDADGYVDVVVDDPDADGHQTIPVDVWLTGQPLGLYKFKVSPVDSNGNVGAEAGINDTYSAPAIDPATLSFIP